MNRTFPLSAFALAAALSLSVFAQDTTQGTGDSQPGAKTQQSLPEDPMKQNEPGTQPQTRPNTGQPGQPGTGQPGTDTGTAQPGTAGQPGTDTTMSKRERDYQAALKKCSGLEGAARQQCVDEAGKKFGHM